MKRTLSIIAALMLTFTMVNCVPEGTISASADNNASVSANDQQGSATLDEQTGVLTLSGHFTKEQVWEYRDNEKVTSVVADEGCVFPADCSEMFCSQYDKYDPVNNRMESHWLNLKAIDFSKADTSAVNYMSKMFFYCDKLENLDISGFDTSNVATMDYMFCCCSSLKTLDLSNFDTSNVGLMDCMFAGCTGLDSVDLSSFDTSNVFSMGRMFYKCSSLTELDLSNFDPSSVCYTGHSICGRFNKMFADCSSLKTIYVSDKWKFNDDLTTICVGSMFSNCTSLVGGNGTKYDEANINGDYARIDKDGQPGYFTEKVSVQDGSVTLDEQTGVLTLSGHITTNQVWEYRENEKVTSVVAAEDCVLPEYCSDMFLSFKDTPDAYGKKDYWVNLTSIDLSKADTADVKSMSGMFRGCDDLEKLDVSGFDTHNVDFMGYMFAGCKNLKTLDVSNFNTSKVIDMTGMFASCSSLAELDLSSFDTSNFNYEKHKLLEITDYMFAGCSSLKTIYVSEKWKLSDEVIKARGNFMFEGCTSLVGGNGTKYDKSNHKDSDQDLYARIDKEGEPGYFTYKAFSNTSKHGDINGDNKIDVEDAVMIINNVNGVKVLTDDEVKSADVDGSGKVDIEDAVAIIAHVNGIKSIN